MAILVALGTSAFAADPAQAPLTASQAKAGLLYNLAMFVEWPADALGEEIVIGVLGDDALEDHLERVSGHRVNGRVVRVRRLEERDDPAGCHVLFVGARYEGSTPRLLARVAAAPVLTVGESSHFTVDGGIMRIFLHQARLRFEIDVPHAERARLRLSSKLLGLAMITRTRPNAAQP